jgi:hypothetical protein
LHRRRGGSSFTVSLAAFSSGGLVEVTVPVTVISATSAGQTVTNTATVATSSLDVVPGNNE